mmetsp:Transcript_13579/g.40305  ORF Transcript_13579/g.40305 Transcript_13579/m.40305 type:complete len:200 (-) Transcript_13579:9-608(-)
MKSSAVAVPPLTSTSDLSNLCKPPPTDLPCASISAALLAFSASLASRSACSRASFSRLALAAAASIALSSSAVIGCPPAALSFFESSVKKSPASEIMNLMPLIGPDPLPFFAITSAMCVSRSNFARYSFMSASCATGEASGGVPSPSDAANRIFCSDLNGSSGFAARTSFSAATRCCLRASAYSTSTICVCRARSYPQR